MRKLTTTLLLSLLLGSPWVSHAALISYELTFGPAGSVDGGSGSFVWDDSSQLISDFTWNFSAGLPSGANPDWSQSASGGTLSQYLFEILTGNDVSPANCNQLGTNCTQQFLESSGLTGLFPSDEMTFILDEENTMSYFLRHQTAGSVTGSLSTRSTEAVPLPTTLALLGIGLLGSGFFRRARKST